MVIYSSTQGMGSVLQLVSTDGRFKRVFRQLMDRSNSLPVAVSVMHV